MIFTLSSLSKLREFQTQTLCLKLPPLKQGEWKLEMSSRIFESVYVSIRNNTEKSPIHTVILRSSRFIAGSSCLNAVDPREGGTVRFPLKDILNLWIRGLRLPETQDSQIFLERIFASGFHLRLILKLADVRSLYISYIPQTILPCLEYWVDSSSLAFAVLSGDSTEETR